MSRHTSLHVGGPADFYFEPRDRQDLAAFLRSLPAEMPVYWIGLGSNLLVRDGGLRGVVIQTQTALTRLERESQTVLLCEAGVPCARLAKQCLQWNLGDAEWFAGIPGTLGGALAMNAGAFGGETWDHVLQVDLLGRDGQLSTHAREEFQVGYRHVRLPSPQCWFVAARLRFAPQAASAPALRALLEKRKESQPIGSWNCGSVFVNPPGDYAARLIEAAGLKGARVGAAVVSDKHANFIVNEGAASAADIEQLIRHVQRTVRQRSGVELRTEVRIVGEPPKEGVR
ncbi:MAG: UDP-N-acetylmuramate dehydrogenase [Steroidobacteraceae bacterium]|nr:UDP-N-acetylmuramate dehydrogenase [Steroidobacteraceae bacterium]